MTASLGQPDDKLDDLLGVLGDSLFDNASPADIARLEQLVCNDDQACELYVTAIFDSLVLRRWSSVQMQDVKMNGRPEADEEPLATFVTPSSIFGLAPTPLRTTFGYLASGWPVAYLAATIMTAIGLLTLAQMHISRPEQVVDHQSPLRTEQQTTPARNTEMPVVGRITGMVDCQWSAASAEKLSSPARGRAVGGEGGLNKSTALQSPVRLGDHFDIRLGLLEITYDTGAKVILQGPVTYEVESRNGGFMAIGRLTGKVDAESAKGFAIKTPTATITDLGTEFGVDVRHDGGSEVHVLKGQVEFSSRDGACFVRLVAGGETSAARLNAGSKGIVRRPAAPELFIRTMPQSQRQCPLDPYAKMVLSLNPVVYYRMEFPKREEDWLVVFDSAPGSHHGVLHLADKSVLPWPAGRCGIGSSLNLRGPLVRDSAIVPDYPKTQNNQLSVSAWVMAASLSSWASIVQNFSSPVTPERGSGQFLFGVTHEGDLAVNLTQQDMSEVVAREGLGKTLPLDDWQHVAFVADGTMVHLYRNGMEVAATPYRSINRNPTCKSLGIGCRPDKSGLGLASGHPALWNGRLDEIAIFNRALRAVEIRQLYIKGESPLSRGNAAAGGAAGNRKPTEEQLDERGP